MRPPARLLAMLACLLAVATAGGLVASGCGSDSSGSPLDNSLGYLPENAPLAVAIETDVDGDQFQALDRLAKRFPFGEQIKNNILRSLAENATGVNLQEDVLPLLGNPFVVGTTSASFLGGSSDGDSGFVAAIQAADKGKLDDLLDKAGARKTGEQSGATIYEESGTTFAVDGDTVVFAGSRDQLNAALERHDGDDKLDEDKFDESLADLGDNGIVRVAVNVKGLLESASGTADARKVKWIGALEDVGLNASIQDDRIEIGFHAATNPDGLSEEDLPIGAGDESPGIVERPGEIGIGIRDIGQIVTFAETVAQAVDPSGYGDYAAAKRQIEAKLGVDLQKDVLDQLSGDISASVDLSGKFGVRAEPEDPAAFRRTLAKVAPVLPDLLEGVGIGKVALAKPKKGDDFYALAQPDGDGVVFGVVDDVFVVASDAARASRLATESPTQAEGAKGAVVVKADAEELANSFLGSAGSSLPIPGQLGQAFTGPLGDLTGWLDADTSGVTGKLTLTLDR
jgi:hypothetical protein